MYDKYSKQELIDLVVKLSIELNNIKLLNDKNKRSKILFSDFINNWLDIHKNKISMPTYDGYSNIITNYLNQVKNNNTYINKNVME